MRTAEPLVKAARRRRDAGPVEAGFLVGSCLPVGERLDRGQRQVTRVERDAVAA